MIPASVPPTWGSEGAGLLRGVISRLRCSPYCSTAALLDATSSPLATPLALTPAAHKIAGFARSMRACVSGGFGKDGLSAQQDGAVDHLAVDGNGAAAGFVGGVDDALRPGDLGE